MVDDRQGVCGVSASAELVDLLSAKTSILLDFDGPVCSIFANRPAPGVAGALRATLAEAGMVIPIEVGDERDPLEVLKWTATLGRPDLVREVESRLIAEEAEAARSSEPTPFGRETVIGGFEAGKPIALVSNNSSNSIRVYLARQRLSRYGMPVSGRAFARPDLMKPNPEPILTAAKALSVSPEDCVLIGDSLADINGAHAAGVAVIGYANRPEKAERFAAAGANIVITTMVDAALALAQLKV